MRTWLAALRIARRETRRAKGRSALVVALIGLPVMAVAFAAVSYDMFTLTAAERLERQLGTADAELGWPGDAPIVQRDISGNWYEGTEEASAAVDHTAAEIRALLPAGSTVVARWTGQVRLPTATGTGELTWQALDLTDPITDGIARVIDGRAPGAAGEIAVTIPAADRLGVAIGDRVAVPGGGDQDVVGVVEFPGVPGGWSGAASVPDLGDQVVLFHPAGAPADGWPRWLVDTPTPLGWEQVRDLNQHGITAYSRTVALDPPAGIRDLSAGPVAAAPQFSVGALIAGLVALEIVLLAGPAFAVGARRRQRDLGLVAAGGGTPAQLRRIVLSDGVVLGVLATGLGIALGIALAFACRPLLEAYLVGGRAGGYRVFPLALAGIALFAVGTALLAALVPAVTAARQQVVDALAGRRGFTRSRRRWLVLGLVMVGLGAGAAGGGAGLASEQVVLAGLIAVQLGLALCTPALVGLVARIGSRLWLAPRIALRDTARNRAATAPAIAAVMAAVAGAVTAGVLLSSFDARYDRIPPSDFAPGTVYAGWDGLAPDAAATYADREQIARATLPVASVHPGWSFGEWAGQDEGVSPPQLLVPEENVCPYWERAWGLSRAEQRAAAQDARCTSSDFYPYTFTAIDDGAALAALVEADPGDLAAAARVLRSGGVVVTEDRFLADGEVILGPTDDFGRPRYDDATTVPGYLLTSRTAGARAIISPATVRAVTGSDAVPQGIIIATERMPTQAEEDALTAALETIGTSPLVTRRSYPGEGQPLLALLAAAAGLVALGATAIAVGLAATDRRGDLSTLGAVGASPQVRRLLSLNQSGVVAGLGTVLGLVAGFGAAAAVVVGLNQQYSQIWPKDPPIPVIVPWPYLVGLLAVPVVAMLGAVLFGRSRLPVERRPG